MTISRADMDSFMRRFYDFPMDERKLQRFLAGHPNASHVIHKHDTAPDAVTFVQGLDLTTAGYIFPEEAKNGELPQTYLGFLSWIPGGRSAWLNSSAEKQEDYLRLYAQNI